jgi:oleate hydratase
MVTNCKVTRLEHRYDNGRFVVTGIHFEKDGHTGHYSVNDDDLVIVQNGSMTDDSSVGSMSTAPAKFGKTHDNGWALWETRAEGRPQFGVPRWPLRSTTAIRK